MSRIPHFSDRRLIQDIVQDTRGNISVIFALALLPIVAAAGAAVDYSRGDSVKVALQSALDAAALAAAKQAASLTSAELTTLATNVFTADFNRPEATNVQVSVQYDPATSKVNVTGSAAVKTAFMGLIGVNSLTIRDAAQAIAGKQMTGPCVVALDSNANKAFSVSGNGSVQVPNCELYINSAANIAVDVKGASSIKTKGIKVVGGVSGQIISSQVSTNQPPTTDPLASIPEPTIPSNCTYISKTFSVPVTLPAGSVYCGNISLDANITFGSGIHYFKGATVTASTNIDIVGDKVMLYFDDTSTLSSTGGGKFVLTAPQSGTYKGIAMFGTRTGALSTFTLTGGKDYFVNGTIYLPTARLQLNGNTDLTVSSKSGYVIVQQFSYQGASSFTFDAFGGAVPGPMGSTWARLTQ